MRSKRNLATLSLAGAVLAVTLATGAAPGVSCLACEVTSSYHAAVRVYDRARAWGVILRWWVDPDYGSPAREERKAQRSSPKTEDLCQARPVDAQVR